jgi:hypothetical protein
MTPGNRRLIQKSIAVIIIVALLDIIGISPFLMMFITGVILVVWLVSRRSQNREIEQVFQFYISSDAILREEDRRWYGFEIAEVIDSGERVLSALPDCPPLHFFTLGALYHRIGNYDATAYYLSRVMEDEAYNELHLVAPSPQLRRYVQMLRRIESEPSIAPQTLAAVRNLERTRRKYAAQMLAESRAVIDREKTQVGVRGGTPLEPTPKLVVDETANTPRTATPMHAPLPISELLHDIYQDDQTLRH